MGCSEVLGWGALRGLDFISLLMILGEALDSYLMFAMWWRSFGTFVYNFGCGPDLRGK